MHPSIRRLAAPAVAAMLAVSILAPRPGAAVKFGVQEALARGHEYASHVVNNQPAPLWAAFSKRMAEAMGDSARFAATLASIQGLTGKADSVLDERASEQDGAYVYEADCRFAKQKEPWTVSIAFDDRARIVGLFVKPAVNAKPTAYASPNLDYVTKTPLRLPFRGEWTVFWGGRTIEQNYHARTRDQRFALDLVITRDGRTHSGDGANLEDYYCYGQPILAPADGRVVWLQDSLPDNRPGRMDPKHPAGNAVILDHGDHEYSLLAHLQPRTLAVRLGERVKAGDEIGRCGNSGNSSEPHLHYHLQDGPTFGDAEGLPPKFVDLFVDGVHVDSAEIVKGQQVRPGK